MLARAAFRQWGRALQRQGSKWLQQVAEGAQSPGRSLPLAQAPELCCWRDPGDLDRVHELDTLKNTRESGQGQFGDTGTPRPLLAPGLSGGCAVPGASPEDAQLQAQLPVLELLPRLLLPIALHHPLYLLQLQAQQKKAVRQLPASECAPLPKPAPPPFPAPRPSLDRVKVPPARRSVHAPARRPLPAPLPRMQTAGIKPMAEDAAAACHGLRPQEVPQPGI